MSIASGTVIAGKVVINGRPLAEGTIVYVVEPEADSVVQMSAAEMTELESGIAEADRGETISEAELLESLRRFG